MSLHPSPIGRIPAETMRVAQAAFPRGTVVTRLRDEFADLYRDEDFAVLYPRRGQPALAPWRLSLVTVLQFLEHLSDRQAADAVRSRIDWKYALGLTLDDPGFHFSVLTEFRARLLAGNAEYLLLDKMLVHFKARGLIKPRGRQRTDSTHVLGAVRDLHLLELVTETLRAALNELAAVAPEWLRGVAEPDWFDRYARRAEDWRLPGGSKDKRAAYAQQVGSDGFVLLDALEANGAPGAAREACKVMALRQVWQTHFERRREGPPRWRDGAELPPVGERIQSPYDPANALQRQTRHGVVGLQGACDRDVRCQGGTRHHACRDTPSDGIRHQRHGGHPQASDSETNAAQGAFCRFGLCQRWSAGVQPTCAWRSPAGACTRAGQSRPGLRLAGLQDRLEAPAGHLSARQGLRRLDVRLG